MLRSENLYEILDKYFSQIQKNSYYKREVQKFLMKKYEYSDIEYMQYIIGAKRLHISVLPENRSA